MDVIGLRQAEGVRTRRPALICAVVAAGLAAAACSPVDRSTIDWPVYGGNAAGQRYSGLDQINRETIGGLSRVWRHETGEGGLQTSPIVVDGVLYGYTPELEVIALNAATGERLWTFRAPQTGRQPSRGLALWRDGGEQRLLAGVMGDLWALDARTGQPVKAFGTDGRVDLRAGLGGDEQRHAVFMTSPGVIYKDLIIVGFRTSETPPAAPGAIRAYDVRTGQIRWTVHTIPAPGDEDDASWPDDARKQAGAANNWTGMVLDEGRGIVYAPTGSAAPDFFGGDRPGDNVGANTLFAISADSGNILWRYQIVRHDILDRDLPSPPVLLTINRDGRTVDAVAQATKHGYLFVLDRQTGEPLFPMGEAIVPESTVPGERIAPTQPRPLLPEPFARQALSEDLLTDRTPEANAWARAALADARNAGPFTPLSLDRQTIVFPGFDGGAEWGGQAVDPATGIFFINANDVAWMGGLRRSQPQSDPQSGAALYEKQCLACHGPDLAGAPPEFPNLQEVAARRTSPELTQIIRQGVGRMPGFPGLSDAEVEGLVAFLRRGPDASAAARSEVTGPASDATGAGYVFTGYRKFLDPEGYPAVKPPWGTLSAIDLNTGRYVWRRPLGEYPELAAQGLTQTGSENYGGPLVTAGGLVFIGATIFDRKFRAMDVKTGETVFEADLPYAGVASPITYAVAGRQYIVIATSGSRDKKGPQGSAYVAFALDQR